MCTSLLLQEVYSLVRLVRHRCRRRSDQRSASLYGDKAARPQIDEKVGGCELPLVAHFHARLNIETHIVVVTQIGKSGHSCPLSAPQVSGKGYLPREVLQISI